MSKRSEEQRVGLDSPFHCYPAYCSILAGMSFSNAPKVSLCFSYEVRLARSGVCEYECSCDQCR